MYLCSFKEKDIVSEWNFNIETLKDAPAAVPVATNTNRKTTKRQLLDGIGHPKNLKRSSIPNADSTAVSSATEQLLKQASAVKTSTVSKETAGETTSVDESEFSTATEEVIMDLSSKQVKNYSFNMNPSLLLLIYSHHY